MTHGRKIAAGFAVVVVLTMAISALAVVSLGNVVDSKDRVIDVNDENVIAAEQVAGLVEQKSASARGFLLSGQQRFVDEHTRARADIAAALTRMARTRDLADAQPVAAISQAEADHNAALERSFELRRGGTGIEDVARSFEADVTPKRDVLRAAVSAFVAAERRLLDEGKRRASDEARTATTLVLVATGVILLVSVGFALVLTRSLTRQIGAAVQHVQSSSAELQAAANQQATGSREQSTAMTEISTTISELLATAKQIAESAQRVAHIAEETATAALDGEETVTKSNEAIVGIRRQVELIVSHMLDLGKKSQQIGGVLEIINELAEQTNILAINATIEAAGAGDAGKRFAVVADEIRKLSDRVSGSTKEIRGLIDEIRAAVNTTVMATEGGTKAVDAGAKQFAEVAASFQKIADLVGTTTEAAREIELSTKQQSSAVEQVNVAVANVAQATRETEASATQTLETASQLTGLSRNLTQLIHPTASA